MLFAEYKELYDFCQKFDPKIRSKLIVDKAKELTGKQFVVIKDSLDVEVLRGYYIASENVGFQTLRDLGKNLIVLAKGQNECYERFVYIKEVMHLFDSGEELTDTSEKFVSLLSDWSSPATFDQVTPQFNADNRAIWMALGCLCPERKRLEYMEKRGIMDNYQVALELKIPEQYVPLLWLPQFPEHMKALTHG